MTTKTEARSRIHEAVHATAADLHRLGFIDKRKMCKFDALCFDPDKAREFHDETPPQKASPNRKP